MQLAHICTIKKIKKNQLKFPYTRVAHGGFVCYCMSRAKLIMNPLIEGPETIFGL